jgi:transcriptional regulator with GAF, ATPase, and Fis domain
MWQLVARQSIHIENILAVPETEFPETVERQRQGGVAAARTMLVPPLQREDVPIGVIVMRRTDVQPFSEKQIELAKTFAVQAVIAIENVRLFQELEAQTAQLTRSVTELRALGEVGQAVTSTLDLETVLNTIVSRAARAAHGHGQVVAIVGEPGVGKSRLVWEVTHSYRVHGWLVLQAGSVSYGKATSYLPVIDLLKGYFAIEDRDGPRGARETDGEAPDARPGAGGQPDGAPVAA